jgi:hypothetical protein
MKRLSVTQYAKYLVPRVTRQAVLLQIKENRLPKNVKAEKIGSTYVILVRESKKTNNG